MPEVVLLQDMQMQQNKYVRKHFKTIFKKLVPQFVGWTAAKLGTVVPLAADALMAVCSEKRCCNQSYRMKFCITDKQAMVVTYLRGTTILS